MAKSSFVKRFFSSLMTWMIPIINGAARALSYTFGFAALLSLFMIGALHVEIEFLLSPIFKILCGLSLGVFFVSVVEGYDLAKMIEKGLHEKLNILEQKKSYTQNKPLNFIEKIPYRILYLFTKAISVLAPAITALFKGGSMAGGTVGTIMFILYAKGTIATTSLAAAAVVPGLLPALIVIGISFGISVAAVSLVRDGKKFFDLAKSKVVDRLKARLHPEMEDKTLESAAERSYDPATQNAMYAQRKYEYSSPSRRTSSSSPPSPQLAVPVRARHRFYGYTHPSYARLFDTSTKYVGSPMPGVKRYSAMQRAPFKQ